MEQVKSTYQTIQVSADMADMIRASRRLNEFMDEVLMAGLLGDGQLAWDRQIHWNGYEIWRRPIPKPSRPGLMPGVARQPDDPSTRIAEERHPVDTHWDARPDPSAWLAAWVADLRQWPRADYDEWRDD